MPFYLRSLTFFCLSAAVAGGASIKARAEDDFPVVNVNNEVGIAFSELLKNYKEYPPPGFGRPDSESGRQPGFAISTDVMRNVGSLSNLFASMTFRYDSGQTNYSGAFIGSDIPVTSQSGLVQKDLRLELGKGFLLLPNLLSTPTFQYGFHSWNRALIGYKETYSDSYVGGAVHMDYALSPKLVARFRAGIATTVNPHLVASDNGYVTYPLRQRPIYQLAGGFDYALTRRLHLTVDADFSHYSYGHSTIGTSQFEPNSSSNDLYVEGGLAYHF